jgi:hypothetical protein
MKRRVYPRLSCFEVSTGAPAWFTGRRYCCSAHILGCRTFLSVLAPLRGLLFVVTQKTTMCSLHPSIHSFIHPSIHPPIHPSLRPFIHPSLHLFIYPSSYRSIYVSTIQVCQRCRISSTHHHASSYVLHSLLRFLLSLRKDGIQTEHFDTWWKDEKKKKPIGLGVWDFKSPIPNMGMETIEARASMSTPKNWPQAPHRNFP